MERFKLKKFLIVSFLFFFSSSILADQKDSRLNTLFEKLYLSSSNLESSIIISDIWEIWSIIENPNVQQLYNKAKLQMDNGEFQSAIQLFTKVININPEFAEAWNKRATTYFLMGEFDKSISDIEKTLILEPRHFGALDGLAEIYLLKKDLIKAAATYEKILKIIPSSKKSKDRLEKINELFV